MICWTGRHPLHDVVFRGPTLYLRSIHRRKSSVSRTDHGFPTMFVCLFVCFESHEQLFSYLVTVTIAGDRAANLDLCLALTPFSSEGSFTCHTYCDTRSIKISLNCIFNLNLNSFNKYDCQLFQ
jgi:hypothetical protein